MARSDMDTCSPVESRRSISRSGGLSLSAAAKPTSSSVVLPMADTTATTSWPACFFAISFFATIWMRSGLATDVPPNLHTISDMRFLFRTGFRLSATIANNLGNHRVKRWLRGCFFTANVWTSWRYRAERPRAIGLRDSRRPDEGSEREARTTLPHDGRRPRGRKARLGAIGQQTSSEARGAGAHGERRPGGANRRRRAILAAPFAAPSPHATRALRPRAPCSAPEAPPPTRTRRT